MNSLYITSIENFSGKTAVCLAIGKILQAHQYKVGYLKPLSHQPTQMGGHVVDEDAVFVKEVLKLSLEAWDLSPVIVTPQLLAECLHGDQVCDFDTLVKDAYQKAAQGVDVMLIEGGGSLRVGYAIRLSTPYVAEILGAKILAIIKFRGQMRMLDDALTAQYRLGDRLMGVLINRIPESEMTYVKGQATPFLEKRGIAVLGTLPEQPQLAAISVGEMAQTLGAEILAGADRKEALTETMMVGAMGGQEALTRFRQYQNKCIVTGGDRVDIQLAALETSTVALILTGNLRPPASVLQAAEQQGVAVLLVPMNTMEAVELLERTYGRTRLGHASKLATFEALMSQHLDTTRLLKLMGIT